MDTISARQVGPATPRAPSVSPVVGPARDRSILVAALLLICGQLALRGWVIAGRQYYADDLRLLHLADGSALFSPSYLLQDYAGHLMPGAFLVAGLVERAGPLAWWPAAVSVIVLQALASLALLRLLWTLLGERPTLLVALAFGLFTPMALGSLTWWAAALNSLPLQIGLAWYVAAAVMLARTGRRRFALSGTAALLFALAFYLKAVLLPPVAFLIVVVVLLRDGTRSPFIAAVRRGWTLWAGTLVVLTIWAVTYLATRQDDPVQEGSASEVVVTVTTGLRALLPTVLGGPFGWATVPPSTPLSDPPQWAAAAGALVLLLAFLWTVVRLRGAELVWLMLVVACGGGLLMAALGRAALGLGHVIPLAYRYFPAEAVLLPVAGALLVSLPRRAAFRHRSAGRRSWSAPPWAVTATAFLTACLVAIGVQSTVGHARAWEGDRGGEFLAAARSSLATAGPEPLLDQSLPSYVGLGMGPPTDRLFGLFAPMPDRPAFAEATSALHMLDDSGRLVPARVEPAVRVVPGAAPECGYPVGWWLRSAILPLEGPLPDGEWTVQLGHTAARDGVLQVALDDGEPVDVPVVAGTSTVFVRLTGAASALRVTSATEGLAVCVSGGAVGLPVA